MWWRSLVLGVAALAVYLFPAAADACGGLFCDGGAPMPVDQSSELVLFAVEDGVVEAHVQVSYTGDPERFAWVVPVPEVPQVSVGSGALMRRMGAGIPIDRSTAGESCESPERDGPTPACGFRNLKPIEYDKSQVDDSASVEIDYGHAGVFEYAIIEAGEPAPVMQWLEDEGYAQDEEAYPILASYLKQGHVLVAFKLRRDVGPPTVHPIVLRYPGSEPCVPIRLTAIGAEPDMGVRVGFLGEHRWAPKNYAHVEPNLLRVAFPGTRWDDAVTAAVDEAGGHAFVTEVAGKTRDVLRTDGLVDPRWDAAAFEGLSPGEAIDELVAQGVFGCDTPLCGVVTSAANFALFEFLPPPEDVSGISYWSCLDCYPEADFSKWNSAGFAQAMETYVYRPAREARDLVSAHPFYTRLFTTLSAHEMTLDPTFHENPDLPATAPSAGMSWWEPCEGPVELSFDDGTFLAMGEGGEHPLFDLPWAARIQDIPARGAPITVVDNRPEIEQTIDEWNDAVAPGCSCRAGGLGSGLWLLAVGLVRRRRRS